jgi:predicted ArsR family transcriptional regulator
MGKQSSENEPHLPERVAAVSALSDPARRAVYEFVNRSTEAVGRDATAAAVNLPRSTVTFHLERLAAVGLVEVEFRRLSGRTGPGSGRPAKLYRRAGGEVSVSLPARRYDLAGDLLAGAIEHNLETGMPVREALHDVAGAAGRLRGAEFDSLLVALEENGFEPVAEGADVVLGNCPFHRLAQRHTDLVCELNYDLVRGLAEGSGDTDHAVRSDPGAGRCCIRIHDAGKGEGENTAAQQRTDLSQESFS